MTTYTIPAVDSAVGSANTLFECHDGLHNPVPPCAYIRPDYLSSRYAAQNPDGTGAFGPWAYIALAFHQADLSFLDQKRLVSAKLWLFVLNAAPAQHSVRAYCPAGGAFIAGSTTGACAYNANAGADLLPHANPGDALAGWRCFTIPSLAVLKGLLQRGARVDDTGLSAGQAAWFVAQPHSHATHAPYIEVQYEDEHTPPQCEALEPSATVVDGDAPVTFRWSYSQAVNTPQSHVSIQVRKTGAAWQNVVTKHAGAQQTYTAPKGLDLRGECQWHVQVFCTGGAVASAWSAVKSFLSTGSPPAPAITGVTPTPVCTVTWQQDAQTGFELEVENENGPLWKSGQRLSADRALCLPLLLRDGGHTLRLRTLNAQGRWGPWASSAFRVQNAPAGAIVAACKATSCGLSLSWTADRAYEEFRVLRNGVPIARLPAGSAAYTDRAALGLCRYTVRGVLGRCYTDSAPALGTCAVGHALLGGAESGDFIPLELRHDAPPRHRQSRAAPRRYLRYQGARLPVGYAAAGQQRGHTLYFTVESRAHYDALLSLVGCPVIYKDREGDAFRGFLDEIYADSGDGFDLALHLTETEEDAHGQ